MFINMLRRKVFFLKRNPYKKLETHQTLRHGNVCAFFFRILIRDFYRNLKSTHRNALFQFSTDQEFIVSLPEGKANLKAQVPAEEEKSIQKKEEKRKISTHRHLCFSIFHIFSHYMLLDLIKALVSF